LYSSFPKVLGMRSIHRHTFLFEDVSDREIKREGWRIEKAVWCILNSLRFYVRKATMLTTTVLFVTFVSARESKDTTMKDTASLNGKPAAYPLGMTLLKDFVSCSSAFVLKKQVLWVVGPCGCLVCLFISVGFRGKPRMYCSLLAYCTGGCLVASRRFEGTYRLRLQGYESLNGLNPWNSGTNDRATQCNNPETYVLSKPHVVLLMVHTFQIALTSSFIVLLPHN
jgi:hypothetical protein